MNPVDHFEEIVRELYEPLFRFAMSLTRMEADALDLTQQTFYVWATKGHQLRDASKVKTWLFTTLHRAFLELRRKRSRFAEGELDELAGDLPEVSPIHAGRLEASEALAALSKVDDVYQAAVALFYLKSCSYADISLILKIPLGTVKSRIARGIAQLRRILGGASVLASRDQLRSHEKHQDVRVDNQHARKIAPPLEDKTKSEVSDRDGQWDLSLTLLPGRAPALSF